MNDVGFGHRVCVGWVWWYTRRLPFEVAAQRRDELLSDLWEHAADAARTGQGDVGHQFDVIGRMVVGVPADLSWRRRVRGCHRPRPVVLVPNAGSSRSEANMSKRWMCRLVGHKYRRYRYPGSGDAGGQYLLCHRCHKERNDDKPQPPGAEFGAAVM